jgi:hypothetical protein
MCQLPTLQTHQKLLPSQTEMCQMCRWPLHPPKMSDVSSVAATIQLIIKVARSTRSSNKKRSRLSDPNSIYSGSSPTHPSYLPRRNICLSRRTQLPATSSTNQAPHPSSPLHQTSDINDLKDMMKRLFEQMSTMLNLLTTVLTKLK